MATITIGAPQPYPSTSASKAFDFCRQGCSFNCPQLCIFPPPPPLFLNTADPDSDGGASSSRISPLMAALIAVLAAAFLLLFYFTVISKLCRRSRNRRRLNRNNSPFLDAESSSDPLARVDSLIHDPTRSTTETGLDDAFIRQITVFKYRRADNLIDGTECAVCLNEFNEEENLRLMPNCEHAFHIPCIDTWLKTHSNCPLCRSTMNPVPPLRSGSNSNTNTGGGSASVAALRVERSSDVVLVVRELESRVQVVEAAQDEVGSGGCGNGNLDERETKLDINHNIANNNINSSNSR